MPILPPCFLASLDAGPRGEIFIFERDGQLVATSTGGPVTQAVGDRAVRVAASAAASPLLRTTVAGLDNLHALRQPQHLVFRLGRERQFVQVVPFRDRYGLAWLIAVVVPEGDFLAQIHANARTTVLLRLGALAIASRLSIVTARWLAEPLLRLEAATQTIAAGKTLWRSPL